MVETYAGRGFEYKTFDFSGHSAIVVMPKVPWPGTPWVWRTEFFGYFDWVDKALLEKGWHVVYIHMSDWYGAPPIIEFMENFYTYITNQYQLNSRMDLFGFSRGGLYALNYAVKNPEKVSTLYLDAPVLDLASWPGGFYQTAAHLEKEWREACHVYGMTSEELVNNKEALDNKFAALVKNQVRLLLAAGMQDMDVPYAENGASLEQYYYKNGGNMKTVIKGDCGHHPHSLEQPEELVEYIVKNFI